MASVGGSNLAGIAQYNERLVLQLIRRAQSLTKADIARITHLSAQTASVIINRLLAEKLLCKQKPFHDSNSRYPSVIRASQICEGFDFYRHNHTLQALKACPNTA